MGKFPSRPQSPFPPTLSAGNARYQEIMARLDAYVDENLGRHIYSDQCAAEVGVSRRTLALVIKALHSTRLQGYIRAKRLNAVRATLQIADESRSIAQVARENGFHHLGEFSQAYKVAFGERPSETLRRRSKP